jgi:hypothetical protein
LHQQVFRLRHSGFCGAIHGQHQRVGLFAQPELARRLAGLLQLAWQRYADLGISHEAICLAQRRYGDARSLRQRSFQTVSILCRCQRCSTQRSAGDSREQQAK